MSLELEQMMKHALEGRKFAFNELGRVVDLKAIDEPFPKPKRDVLRLASPSKFTSERLRQIRRQRESVLRVSEIMDAVSEVTGIDTLDMTSDRRFAPIVYARLIYYWMARKHTLKSLPMIGKACGGRDHSTIMSGIRKVDNNYMDYAEDITKVRKLLCLE